MAKVKGQHESNKSSLFFFFHHPYLWFALLCTITYGGALWLGYTELDDSIFIREMKDYNADWSNVLKSFGRGVFNPTKDIYYRPLFLIDFIFEGHLFGTEIGFYHLTNFLMHLVNVCLVFKLFRALNLDSISAFVFASMFAVHPVLAQAVVWIPGRNDMLLSVFLLGSLLSIARYFKNGSSKYLLLSGLLFLLSLFTKETALVFPFICFAYLVLVLKVDIKSKRMFALAGSLLVCYAIYWLVRSTATLADSNIGNHLFDLLIYRAPLILQYIGKSIIPFNLSVYPSMEDTQNIYGVLAVVFLLALFFVARSYTDKVAVWGLLWFAVFLFPLLLVPKEMNNQIFEHRLYLPLIGLLIFLARAVKLSGQPYQNIKIYTAGLFVLVFAIISFCRKEYFKDPVTFWTKAVADSPHSASAKTLLGMRLYDLPNRKGDAINLFQEAYKENPDERWLNYFLAKHYQSVDSFARAEFHARKEIAVTNYYEANFLMANLKFQKSEKDSALYYLEKVAQLNPRDERIYNNMTMLYLEKKDIDSARRIVEKAQTNGIILNPDLIRAVAMK